MAEPPTAWWQAFQIFSEHHNESKLIENKCDYITAWVSLPMYLFVLSRNYRLPISCFISWNRIVILCNDKFYFLFTTADCIRYKCTKYIFYDPNFTRLRWNGPNAVLKRIIRSYRCHSIKCRTKAKSLQENWWEICCQTIDFSVNCLGHQRQIIATFTSA